MPSSPAARWVAYPRLIGRSTNDSPFQDLRSVLRRTASFLGAQVPADKEDAVLEHLSFASMKNNPSVNLQDFIKPKSEGDAFIRQGEAGAWKKRLSEEQVARLGRWCSERLQGTDYPHFAL